MSKTTLSCCASTAATHAVAPKPVVTVILRLTRTCGQSRQILILFPNLLISCGAQGRAWAREEYYTTQARFLCPRTRPPRTISRLNGDRAAVLFAVLNCSFASLDQSETILASSILPTNTMIATASSQKAFLGTGLQTQQPK